MAQAKAESATIGPLDRFHILNVGVTATDLPRAVRTIQGWVAARQRVYVTVTGVHGVMEAQANPAFRCILADAAMVTPDGMPLVYLGRLRGFPVRRVYGPDLMLNVMAASTDGSIRHYFYGGAPGVAELLEKRLADRFPGVTFVGRYTPPFRPLTEDEEDEVVARINASGADIVWVGLSTPRQEVWMARMRERLRAPVLIGVGAAFDFHAGLKPQAPRLMQVLALEWLFRLCTEPRRLWRRYLYNNPRFIYYLMQEMILSRRRAHRVQR